MKIRYGFVSNSSSSSFVVTYRKPRDWLEKLPPQLSIEDEEKLLERGFRRIGDDKETISYKYDVLCNESDVMEFLLREKIPFEAECHYGHYHVFYNREKDEVIWAWNYGCEISTYGPEFIVDEFVKDGPYCNDNDPIKVFTREEFLKRGCEGYRL